MNKTIIILVLLLVSSISYSQKDTVDTVQKAYMKSNKKVIKKASPMINFFLKYQDSSKAVTQGDFNKLLSIYGGSGKKEALSEQQAFSIVDSYIKASEGKKEKPEKETIDETKSGDTFKTEEEKLKEKAEEELPGQMKLIIGNMSYDEFKKLMQMAKPNATEGEIRKEYEKFKKSNQKL